MKILPTDFEGQSIRRVFDEDTESWWFSVIDVVQVLTESKSAKRYWSDLKRKLAQEAGSGQPYEEIVRLKLTSTDGKQRDTDCAKAATLLRIVQSIPSPKAEPIKLWLAKVGYERMQEMADPALSLNRARQTWQQHGRSDKWHMDCAAHDGAGNPQQTHRLLELFPNRAASTFSTAHDFLIK
jgi:DNA-damage-inducible protein D